MSPARRIFIILLVMVHIADILAILGDTFNFYDKDKSGTLERREALRISLNYNMLYDANKDNYLSITEFKKFYDEHHDEKMHEIDTNHDLFVDPAELLAYAKPMMEDMNVDCDIRGATGAIYLRDKDRDGVWDKTELETFLSNFRLYGKGHIKYVLKMGGQLLTGSEASLTSPTHGGSSFRFIYKHDIFDVDTNLNLKISKIEFTSFLLAKTHPNRGKWTMKTAKEEFKWFRMYHGHKLDYNDLYDWVWVTRDGSIEWPADDRWITGNSTITKKQFITSLSVIRGSYNVLKIRNKAADEYDRYRNGNTWSESDLHSWLINSTLGMKIFGNRISVKY